MNRILTWKINWYRQSELEGALLLGRVVRQANDPYLISQLVRHAADEARHAAMWQDVLERLELPAVRILRSYQSFYGRHIAPPVNITEVLALTHAFEERVWRQFELELRDERTPTVMCSVIERLHLDESGHLNWVARYLADQQDGERLIAAYRRVDEQVYAELMPFEQRLWDVPGLGVELSHASASPFGREDEVRIDKCSAGSAQQQEPIVE